MWEYKDYLEFPVRIKNIDLKLASIINNAIGGQAGELNACIRYYMQSFTMPDKLGKTLLREIATEEMAHVEILSHMYEALTKNATAEDYKKAGLEARYSERKNGLYPVNSFGDPYKAEYFSSTGDYIADLVEDMAAEQKARASYEAMMDLTNDPSVLGPLSFLRQREIIHYQRFAEALKHYQELNGQE